MNRYYFSLQSVKLADFLNEAILSNPILREKPFFFEGDNLCLGLVLSNDEKDRLEKLENDNFIYKDALPMSRLIGMYFNSKDQLEKTIHSIGLGTAFIPKDVCFVEELSKKQRPDKKQQEDISDKIKEFDRYLGAMAFLRYKPQGDEFISSYFDYLDYFLKKKDLVFEGFDKIKEKLNNKLTKGIVDSYKKENNIDPKEKELKEPSQEYNLLNILSQIRYYCGEDSSKKISDFLQLKSYELPYNEDDLYFALGYYVGYSGFTKSELNKKIKFEFNSFDFLIIEIVYSFVFQRELSEDFKNYIEKSKFLEEHFASLIFNKSSEDRKIFLSLYNNVVHFIIEKCNSLLNQIENLQDKYTEFEKKIENSSFLSPKSKTSTLNKKDNEFLEYIDMIIRAINESQYKIQDSIIRAENKILEKIELNENLEKINNVINELQDKVVKLENENLSLKAEVETLKTKSSTRSKGKPKDKEFKKQETESSKDEESKKQETESSANKETELPKDEESKKQEIESHSSNDGRLF